MTQNRRAKKDARQRKAATGEPYTAARRQTERSASRLFRPDCCANCMAELSPRVERLFCSELCRQTAQVVRYWRGVVRDDRILQPDVQIALKTRVALLLGGGYAEHARRLPSATRRLVWARDEGRCRSCGDPGDEIDHIDGSSPELTNLQLLCQGCHRRKTESRMVPASPEAQLAIRKIERERVLPVEPRYLCDDRDEWAGIERVLRKERRQRFLAELADYGYDQSDFLGYSWDEMWDEVLDEGDDIRALGMDDDSGFGPDSYFAHAMAKDD